MTLYQHGSKLTLKDDNSEQQLILLTSPILVVPRIISGKPYVFSLTPVNGFYINEENVAKNVTSFILLDDYLLLTTTQNSVYCIRTIESQIIQLQCTFSLNDKFFSRSIEQGGLLLCGIPGTSVIVLQIPRGNLEIISCRVIAIDILENLLASNRWSEALHFIRTDRLNSNLLIDLNPQRFIEHIADFVAACETPAVLNAFCQEVDDSNVLKTIYAKCWIKPLEEFVDKRKKVCEGLLEYLEEDDYANHITTIMIIYVYHFCVEDALVYVLDLLQRSKVDESMRNVAAVAVKTLNIHTKDEDLFKKALLLYNTELARYVASFSQMDPKSYEPFLNDLDRCSEVQRRFEINVYSNRLAIAVEYLLRNPEVDGVVLLDFIKRNKVCRNAYDFVTKDSVLCKDISKLYGEELSSKSAHAEAGVVYSRGEMWPEAFLEFKRACDWQRAINALNKFQTNVLERHRMINELADNLVKVKRVQEASRIFEEYLKNYEMAIRVLTEGFYFKDAVLLAEKYNRADIIGMYIVVMTVSFFFIARFKKPKKALRGSVKTCENAENITSQGT